MQDLKAAELKRKIREIEQENDQLQARLARSTKHLMRLRLEKRILLDKFQELNPTLAKLDTPITEGAGEH